MDFIQRIEILPTLLILVLDCSSAWKDLFMFHAMIQLARARIYSITYSRLLPIYVTDI